MKALAGIGALLAGARFPVEDPAWARAKDDPDEEWAVGRSFLYDANAAIADRVIFASKLPMILLAAAGGLALAAYARRQIGPVGGLAALALYVLCPDVLAHGRLVTTDLPLAAFSIMAVAALDAALEDPRPRRIAALSGAAAAALLTKYSAVLLAPVLGVVALAAVLRARDAAREATPADPRATARRAAAVLALGGAGALALVALAVGPGRYIHGMGRLFANHIAGYEFYLRGATSTAGFRTYYIVALLVKLPLGTLALAAAGAAALARGRRDRLVAWGGAALVYVGAASALKTDLGVRYVLPALPFLFLLGAAAVARGVEMGGAARALALAALAATAVETAAATPDWLSFFNAAAGGPAGGIEWLDDSNVDWGEDLPRLAAWCAAHGVRPDDVTLAYFGTADPRHYGLAPRSPDGGVAGAPLVALYVPPSGVYAISAHVLVRTRIEVHRARLAFPWTERWRPVTRLGGLWIYEVRASLEELEAERRALDRAPEIGHDPLAHAALAAVLARAGDLAGAREESRIAVDLGLPLGATAPPAKREGDGGRER